MNTRRFALLLTLALPACSTLPAQSPADAGPADLSEPAQNDAGLRQCVITELHPLPPAAINRPVGAPCAFGSQCRSGGCSADVAAGGCGICLDVQSLGARCDGPMQGCSASATCQQGVCKSWKKVIGNPCKLGPKGGDEGECDDDLYCNGKPGETGICATRLPPGSDCTWYGVPCARSETCDGKHCFPAYLRAKIGEGCLGRTCEDGLFCNPVGYVCAQPTLQKGDACGIQDGHFIGNDCAPGLTCGDPRYPNGGGGTDAKSTCIGLPGQCKPCNIYHCAPGLFCMEPDPHSSGIYLPICEHLHREGEPCSTVFWWNIDCAPDLECRKGVCVPACK